MSEAVLGQATRSSVSSLCVVWVFGSWGLQQPDWLVCWVPYVTAACLSLCLPAQVML